MDANGFRSNDQYRDDLRRILEDPTLSIALAIIRLENEPRALPLDAPEIASVRVHAQYRGAKRVLDGLLTLTTPLPPERPAGDVEGTYEPEDE